MDKLKCPLCLGLSLSELYSYEQKFRSQRFLRRYLLCDDCGLVHLDPGLRVEPRFEKERYEEHQNDISDVGYRRFLGQLCDPLFERLPRGAYGLDFGSGPSPAGLALAKESGFEMAAYDPFFANDLKLLERDYDFVLCTEVVEHFSLPSQGWSTLQRVLNSGGQLGVMTDMLSSLDDFPSWHYHRDLTHISFYQKKTMEWIGAKWSLKVDFLNSRALIFSKQ